MVKVGFICEGETEKIILDSENFVSVLAENNCSLIKTINASGNGNLLPKNIGPFIQNLKDEGAEKIFILSDLDNDQCITKTKARISAPADIIVIISLKQVESWFLADNITLSRFFDKEIQFDFPENEADPRNALKHLFLHETGRGIGESKPKLAKRFITEGFSVLNAANHPNCSSVKYLIDKITALSL